MRPVRGGLGKTAVPNILRDIVQRRRVEPTIQGIGTGRGLLSKPASSLTAALDKETTAPDPLVQLCLKATIASLGTPCAEDKILFLCSKLPRDFRLLFFDEISKTKGLMSNGVIHLLANTDISFVSLASDRITSTGLELLAKSCPNLRHLYLRGCNSITMEGVINLLRVCKEVVSVDLGWTEVFEKATEQEVRTFFDVLNPDLQLFSMRGSDMRWIDLRISSICEKCKNLKSLNLGKVKSLRHEHLCAVLSSCPNISDLDVSGIGLADAELLSIASLLNKSLTSIDLERNFCSDSAIEKLAESCPNLKVINLQNVSIGDVAVNAIAKACVTLESLNLAGCFEVTDVSITAIANSTGPHLREINLQALYQLTSESINALVTKCTELNGIEIPQNSKFITPDFREKMGKDKEWKRSKKVPSYMD